MSTRTWVMMCAILVLNWGGFALALAYGIRREAKKRQEEP